MPALKESSQVYDPHLPVGERMTGKTAVVVNRCLREARFLEFCQAFIGVAWTVDRVCLELGACVWQPEVTRSMCTPGPQVCHILYGFCLGGVRLRYKLRCMSYSGLSGRYCGVPYQGDKRWLLSKL